MPFAPNVPSLARCSGTHHNISFRTKTLFEEIFFPLIDMGMDLIIFGASQLANGVRNVSEEICAGRM